MSAASCAPRPNVVDPSDHGPYMIRRRRESGVLTLALMLAVLSHVGILLLVSFPERVVPIEPREPDHAPPSLVPFHPRPPELPPRPRPRQTEHVRLMPWPDPDPQVEPVTGEPPTEVAFDPPIVDSLTSLSLPMPPPVPDMQPLIPGREGVSHPVLLHRVEPVYPDLARHVRLSGHVVLRAVVRSDGSVGELELLRVAPSGVGFEEAAIDAVSQWLWEPALQNGRSVEVYLTVYVNFALH